MTQISPLYRTLRRVNALLLAVGLAFAFDQSVAAALARVEGGQHWETSRRELTIVDRTGDPAWHEASRRATEVWNMAAAGTGLHLSWEAGAGPCVPDGTRVSLCLARQAALSDGNRLNRQGVARVMVGQGHTDAAIVAMCRNCAVDDDRRRVIATHEIGHVLGLPHNTRPESVMHSLGGTRRARRPRHRGPPTPVLARRPARRLRRPGRGVGRPVLLTASGTRFSCLASGTRFLRNSPAAPGGAPAPPVCRTPCGAFGGTRIRSVCLVERRDRTGRP